jgi:hypothetical protein
VTPVSRNYSNDSATAAPTPSKTVGYIFTTNKVLYTDFQSGSISGVRIGSVEGRAVCGLISPYETGAAGTRTPLIGNANENGGSGSRQQPLNLLVEQKGIEPLTSALRIGLPGKNE